MYVLWDLLNSIQFFKFAIKLSVKSFWQNPKWNLKIANRNKHITVQVLFNTQKRKKSKLKLNNCFGFTEDFFLF